MTVHVHIENIFATPIYTSSIEFDVEGFDVNSYPQNSINHENNNFLNISDDEFILNRVEFQNLRKYIDLHMENYYYNILQYSDEIYPFMCSSWLVHSFPNQHSTRHIHGNSIFSGVYYVKVPPNSGDLIFTLSTNDDRNLFSMMQPQINVVNHYNTRVFRITPQNNMLVIFPSQLTHEVDTNRSSEDRISIAFNYFLKGRFTARAGKLEL